jgi:preprotein translocase subunit SecB
MENSKFQFKEFLINRSFIEKKEGNPSANVSLNFSPKGIVNKTDSCFQLQLCVKIEDSDKIINIEIDAVANFYFDKDLEIQQLNNYFYINAPALLFPYIRAYISTLTNLSGYKPINLPTMNLTSLGKELKDNTVNVENCN